MNLAFLVISNFFPLNSYIVCETSMYFIMSISNTVSYNSFCKWFELAKDQVNTPRQALCYRNWYTLRLFGPLAHLRLFLYLTNIHGYTKEFISHFLFGRSLWLLYG